MLLGTSKKLQKERESMEGIVTRSEKEEAKWRLLYSENGEPVLKLLYKDDVRDKMIGEVNAARVLLKLKFNPKVVSFETHVDDYIRKY